MQGDPPPGSPESVWGLPLQVLWLGDPSVVGKQGWLGTLGPLQAGKHDHAPRNLCNTIHPP